MKNTASFLALLGMLIVASDSFASESITNEMLSNACAGCHGTKGVSVGPSIPTIAGISTSYFVTAMQGYKRGEWASTVMGRIAKFYDDEQITAMGEFFSKQKFIPANQTVDSVKAKLGESLHKRYCEKCHENNGAGGGVGILSGQWMPYLQATINDYVAGVRYIDKKMKANIDAILSEHKWAGIEALVHFYGSKK